MDDEYELLTTYTQLDAWHRHQVLWLAQTLLRWEVEQDV